MAKILCAYSGVEFQTEHFNFALSKRECVHPIFFLEHKKLLAQVSRWSQGVLSPTETYLYFLALLNSTNAIEWRSPASVCEESLAIANNNIESLVMLLNRIHDISHPAFMLAHISINHDTASLSNTKYWIETWQSNYADFCNGYRNQNRLDKVAKREYALEKLIKNPFKTPENYATTLSSWAALAGSFPQHETLLPSGEFIPLSDYWCSIIKKCCNQALIFTIPSNDLEELIQHCEENIPHGSIYATKLMQLLRNGRNKQQNYLGTRIAPRNTLFISDDNTETTNLLNMIHSAPQEKPIRESYPKLIDYLKAKACWDAAQEYKQQGGTL